MSICGQGLLTNHYLVNTGKTYFFCYWPTHPFKITLKFFFLLPDSLVRAEPGFMGPEGYLIWGALFKEKNVHYNTHETRGLRRGLCRWGCLTLKPFSFLVNPPAAQPFPASGNDPEERLLCPCPLSTVDGVQKNVGQRSCWNLEPFPILL